MKKIIFTIILLSAFSAEYASAQNKKTSKSRIGRKVPDTSLTRYKQRNLLRITDTTGIGIADTTEKFNSKPSDPSLPPQNNPNPHSPNPSVVNPERPAAPATTTKPPDSTGRKR